MTKKCVKVVCGTEKTERRLYIDDIKKAHSYRKRRTPKVPRYDLCDQDELTISSEIRKCSYNAQSFHMA